ncbi:unnamed protein product [Cylindrotheca closterium]|uniref:Uncharacterized protein n=1 Tax=Cylindrotheca closterium TaxID=2856 RepID=A0AAD2JN38_9STRA|nr:unnamed protein product [Cylindrotheca closterium]
MNLPQSLIPPSAKMKDRPKGQNFQLQNPSVTIMKLVAVVLFLSLCFQTLHLTIAKDDPLLLIDDSKSATRSLQEQGNDTTTTDPPIETIAPVNDTEIPSDTPMQSNSTESEPPTSAPSAVATATMEPTFNTTDDEPPASEPDDSSSGLQTTDIALIVVGLLGIGCLGFGVGGSFLSGGKDAVNENANGNGNAAAPTPSLAPAAVRSDVVEIAEA